jgi:hypothetical protein
MAAAERIMDRIVNSMGVIDYSATVEYTDGYSTHTEEICKLSDDAKDRPIYSLFTATQFKDFSQFLPKETDSFTLSGGLNPEALYDFILDSIRLAGDAGDEIIAKWEGIQKQLGFDLRKDLLGWIEGESIKVTLKKDKGSVLLFKVNDEEAARKMVSGAIAFLSEKLTQVISENPKMAPLAMLSVRTSPIDRDDLKGFQNIYFSMSPKPAVWGVADGYLVFGSSADAVALCLETAKGAHPNIKENQAAMSQLLVPKGPFVELSLDDLSGQGQEMSAGLGMASMVLGMMGSFIPEPEVQPILAKFSSILGKLSPVVLKIDFYKSKSSLTTFDGKAWHTSAVTHYLSPEERAKAEQENEEE